jgi:hypothetical protein
MSDQFKVDKNLYYVKSSSPPPIKNGNMGGIRIRTTTATCNIFLVIKIEKIDSTVFD